MHLETLYIVQLYYSVYKITLYTYMVESRQMCVLQSSSVASFLVWGGGGQDPQMYRQKKKNHVHVTYMRERAKRASASETYTFSGLKILHANTINAVPLYYLWRYKWKYTDKTLTLRKSMNMRASGASELRQIFAFSHNKTAISLNILVVPEIMIYIYTLSANTLYSGLKIHLHA